MIVAYDAWWISEHVNEEEDYDEGYPLQI